MREIRPDGDIRGGMLLGIASDCAVPRNQRHAPEPLAPGDDRHAGREVGHHAERLLQLHEFLDGHLVAEVRKVQSELHRSVSSRRPWISQGCVLRLAHHYVAHISTHDQLALDRCTSPPGTSTVDPWHPGWQPPPSMRARCGGADDRHALEPDRGPHRQVSAARVPELAGSSRRAPVPRPRRPVGLVGGRPGPVLELHHRLLRGRVLDAVDDGAHRRSDAARPLVQRRPAELGPARTAPRDRRRHGAGVRPGGRRTGARDHPRGPSPIGGGGGGLAAPGRRAPG